MLDEFKIVHTLERDFMFKGLSTEAIQFLRVNGLWMPVTPELLSLPTYLQDDDFQVYLDIPEHMDYLTFIIEHNEFLTGQVYNHVDTDAINVEGYLHQYIMEDNSLMIEVVQAIHNNVAFLALTDIHDELIIGWDDEDIETVLRKQKR